MPRDKLSSAVRGYHNLSFTPTEWESLARMLGDPTTVRQSAVKQYLLSLHHKAVQP